jgi:hypothetical protein
LVSYNVKDLAMKAENNQIINELQEVAPHLAAAGSELPYGVPAGYFDGFVSSMLLKVRRGNLSDVPAGYFNQFAVQMLNKVRNNEVRTELEEISPFLNSLPKSMPFSLPNDYFEELQPTIPKEKVPEPAKVVSIGRTSQWKQWAAAAAILFTLGIGWQFLINKPVETMTASSIDTAASVDTLLTGVDANSLTEFLEEEQANSAFASLLMVAEQDVETGVTQLTDEELKWYLENQAVAMPGT